MSKATTNSYDAIVVGLGAMGSATLFHLASRGANVLGIEQFAQGHTLGSSHGDSRIIREQYFEHPLYVPLVQRAFQLWRDLEQASDRDLMTITGGMMIGPREGSIVTGTLRSAIEHHLPQELLTAPEVQARFPAFEPRRDLVATFDARAGILDADACNSAHIEAAIAARAEARFEEPVLKWEADKSGVRVTTARATYSASRLLLTTGSWTNEVLRDLDLPLQIEREVLFWFNPPQADEDAYGPSCFPIFCYEYVPDKISFGLARTPKGVKAGIHHSGVYASRTADVKRTIDPNEVDEVRESLRPVLPELASAPVLDSGICIYTNTPDDNFVIDWHPRHSNVLVSSPCSGHGFKFATVLGEIQADLLTTGRSAFDISPFRIDRFNRS